MLTTQSIKEALRRSNPHLKAESVNLFVDNYMSLCVEKLEHLGGCQLPGFGTFSVYNKPRIQADHKGEEDYSVDPSAAISFRTSKIILKSR